MPTVTAAELALMQAEEESLMSSTAIIYRSAETPDAMGGMTQTWTAAGTVLADVYPAERLGDEEIDANKVLSVQRWYVLMPVGTDVTVEDRVQVDSRTYSVEFVPDAGDHITGLQVEATIHNTEQRA